MLDTFNFADIWEAVADQVGERTAIVCDGRRETYAELDERATRLARWLIDQGVQPGDHIGLYLINTPEYLEAMLAAFKVRAVPINVNFRYVAGELVDLLTDAEVVGVLFHRQFAERVGEIKRDLPNIGWWVAVDDGSGAPALAGQVDRADVLAVGYEDALSASSPDRGFGPRSNDDHYVIYTGGTTGPPKGVVWRQEDAFFSCIGGGDPTRMHGPVSAPAEVVDRVIDGSFVFFPSAPLMHAAGQWTSLACLFAGGTVVLVPGPFDAATVWRTVERERVNVMAVVGDATVRPLVDTWGREGPFDVSSLLSIGSGGAPLTPTLKRRLREALPNCALVDGFGSSESGAQGSARLEVGQESGPGVVAFKAMGGETAVLDTDSLRPLEPGTGRTGCIARRGHIPLEYHNDPELTAARFVTIDDERWVITGDLALLEADGTIVLLGRGSSSINTGGEKVHPEEVEAVLKAHAEVYDAVVVGVPDERWGQAVGAVVQLADGSAIDIEALIAHSRAALAGYKVPKRIVLVSRIERSPAGKADLRWATAILG